MFKVLWYRRRRRSGSLLSWLRSSQVYKHAGEGVNDEYFVDRIEFPAAVEHTPHTGVHRNTHWPLPLHE